jgi:hypothetical protein
MKEMVHADGRHGPLIYVNCTIPLWYRLQGKLPKKTIRHEYCMFWLKMSYTTVCLIPSLLCLEWLFGPWGHRDRWRFTRGWGRRVRSWVLSVVFNILILILIHLIGGFIDDDTPRSGTQQHTSWSTRNDEDLDVFFARFYERIRSRRMRPTVEDATLTHNCIRSLPGADEFPLGRIGCLCFIF